MKGGWRYRVASLFGTAALTLLAVSVAGRGSVQAAFSVLPVVGHLPFGNLGGREFAIEAATATLVVVAAMLPLYKPRPRRILDIGLSVAFSRPDLVVIIASLAREARSDVSAPGQFISLTRL
jgi:hypothetical protein